MPIEIIRRLQQERQEEAKREEMLRREELRKQTLAQAEAAEIRRHFVVSSNNDINDRSNISSFLTRINNEMFGWFGPKHKYVYNPETGKCALAWGRNFEVENSGEVITLKDYDVSSIEVFFDPDQKTTTIVAGKTTVLEESEWLDHKKVEQLLAESFLEPKEQRVDHSPSISDGGGDIGGGR